MSQRSISPSHTSADETPPALPRETASNRELRSRACAQGAAALFHLGPRPKIRSAAPLERGSPESAHIARGYRAVPIPELADFASAEGGFAGPRKCATSETGRGIGLKAARPIFLPKLSPAALGRRRGRDREVLFGDAPHTLVRAHVMRADRGVLALRALRGLAPRTAGRL